MKNLLLTVTLSVFLASPQAFSWSDMGHQIVGAIAEETIEPQTKDFVRGILGVEALSVAAIWPDHERDDSRFGHKEADPDKRDADNHDFASYHFCEIPTGYNYQNKPNKDVKDCHGAITNAVKILKDTSDSTSREEKMIALRYLVHVVGDVHQPLHVGNGHDLGANACQIQWKKSAAHPIRLNLHSFWDNDMVQYVGQSFAKDPGNPSKRPALYLGDYMTNMKRIYPQWFGENGKQLYGKADLDQWLLESQQIRESGLYPDNLTQVPPSKPGEEYKNRPYCDWYVDQDRGIKGPGSKIDPTKIPVLDPKYAEQFRETVQMQLLKGGLRLAATLDQIAKEVANSGKPYHSIDDGTQEMILKKIQDSFRNSTP